MLRQTISATSRALRSTARLSAQRPAASLAQSFQTPFVVSRTIAPRTRWYSSETDAAKNNGEEAKKEEGEAESPEAALRKQLEAKDAEIKELKVCIPSAVSAFSMLIRCPVGQVPPLRSRVPKRV
jgi:molecular chaperone GrpE